LILVSQGSLPVVPELDMFNSCRLYFHLCHVSSFLNRLLVSQGSLLTAVISGFNSDICVRIPEPPAGEPDLSIGGLLFPV
jgi:hypothetical protein